jgi:DNA repair exonuclease SbcCD nuclease subunit
MKIVHLSDLHLGYRQYQRQTAVGINQREADVAATFKRVIDKAIELSPDLVLIAGDVFHAVRPTNPAILHAFTQFARLMEGVPNATVVMIAGNHDTPRTAETGCILRLFSPLGIHVVEGDAQRIVTPDGSVSILAVPDMPMGRPALTPSPDTQHNVLLLHGEVEGVLPEYLQRVERSDTEISKSELTAGQWDYVALGHYHVYREVAPRAYYAGSIDYTSSDVWGEMREERKAGIHEELAGGKGVIEHDLVTHAHTFHHLPVSRPFVDLRPIDAGGMTVADLNAAIRERVDTCPGGIDEKVVRLIIRDVPRHISRELDYKSIREFKRRALHFHLDPRRPETVRRSASGAPFKRPSLSETVREKLETRVLTEDIDKKTFVELGLSYLRQADTLASASPALEKVSG